MITTMTFRGGRSGEWSIRSMTTLTGAPLPEAYRLAVHEVGPTLAASEARDDVWTLRGFTSNTRYANHHETRTLRAVQADLGRPEARCAALIPIRKSDEWWTLAQDERREIFEEVSHHTRIGLDYLPAIARKLHHSRDLGEPFDFLTWFEYAPADEASFDAMLVRLRATREWTYVDREIDIRLIREV
ncbi:MAG: chlorite dismutase family protein [Alphaproteobacteria bacterium]|nr:chlorite dismutase family protein [Alphaproteobacteria bacterium]